MLRPGRFLDDAARLLDETAHDRGKSASLRDKTAVSSRIPTGEWRTVSVVRGI